MFVHRLSRLRYSAYGSLAHQVSVSLFQPTARKNLATLSIRDKIRLRLQAKEQRIEEKSKKAVVLPVEPEEPEAVKHKLFIGNLSYKTNSRALEEHLTKLLGYPMKAAVSVGLNGKSLGYSIVEFDSEDDAERAIELLNETELDSRRIFVHQDRAKDNLLDTSKYVVVSNLPPQANWRLLKALFRPAGSVLVSRFIYDDKGNKGNTCFLSFHSAKHAHSAVSLFHNTAYEENVLSVRLATEQDEFITLREPTWARKIEIDNLAEAVQWRDLRDLCETIGKVLNVDVGDYDEEDESRSASILFEGSGEAKCAVRELNNVELHGQAIRVRAGGQRQHDRD